MYWFRRPPYARWAAAALVLAVAAVMELRDAPTELYPFVTVAVEAGEAIDEDHIDWREVPRGLLPPPAEGAIALHPLPAGSPLVPGAAGAAGPVPDGWWALPVPDLGPVPPGEQVRLLIAEEPGTLIEGVVVSPGQPGGPFSGAAPGLVAVPEEAAGPVGAAAAAGRVVVLRQPGR